MDESDTEQDMVLIEGKTETIRIVVGVVLAALYAVLALLPMSGFVGAGGVTSLLSFAIIIAPLFGLLLGPTRGFVFGLIAGVLAYIVTLPFGTSVYIWLPPTILGPAIAGLFTGLAMKKITKIRFGLPLRPTTRFVFSLLAGILTCIVALPVGTNFYTWLLWAIPSTIVTGLFTWLAMKKLAKIRNVRLPGPILTALFLAAIIVLYEIPNYSAWWFMTPYLLALIIVLLLQVRSIEFNPDRQGPLRYLQLLPFTFIGAMLDHSMMAMGSVYLLVLDPAIFGFVIFPLVLLERGLAAIVGAVIASVVLGAFRTAVWIEAQVSSAEPRV